MAAEESKFSGMNVEIKTPSDLKRKDIIMWQEGDDVKLIEVSVVTKSKPGKHGSAKYNIQGVNLANSKNFEFTEGAKSNLHICTFQKNPCMLVSINHDMDEFIVFNEATFENATFSVKMIPAEALEKIEKVKEASPDAEIKFNLVDTPYLVNVTDMIVNL